jgi:hypothetical protein
VTISRKKRIPKYGFRRLVKPGDVDGFCVGMMLFSEKLYYSMKE